MRLPSPIFLHETAALSIIIGNSENSGDRPATMENAEKLNKNSQLYVIGDIHGRLDLLDQLIEAIRRDVDEHGNDSLTVTLGDYIDRGPDSRGVIERLLTNPFPGRYVALKGNHEALLETFLDQPAIGGQWRHLGGLETLHSFGVPVGSLMVGRNYDEAAKQLRVALSPKYMGFFASLKTSLFVEQYFLCHAGVRPGIPLERQSEEDLLWIRDEFLNSRMDFGKIVVHGHTPVEEPEVLSNRINIDTGAFATGRLTCVVLEGESHRFIRT
jgi:serine/threonine protein phosphatase 1